MEVAFLGHIVGWTGLVCDPEKISAVRNWHAPGSVKQVRQFVGFIGLSEPLVALTRKRAPFVWTDRQQVAFDTLKTCLINAPHRGWTVYLGYGCQTFCGGGGGGSGGCDRIRQPESPTISTTVLYDTPGDAGGGRHVHPFPIISTGARFTLRTDHSSFRWLQMFRNSDGMLAHWYMLLGQFSFAFEYRPGAQHANADVMSRQCGQCMSPGCPVSSPDSRVDDADSMSALLDQPFASSEMGDSMDADLLPELSGETWVAATYLDELTSDLLATDSDLDFIVASRRDETLTTVRHWEQTGAAPVWSECLGLSPEMRCWRLQFGILSVDTEGRLWRRWAPPAMSSQLIVPARERQDLIRRYHDSLFAGHLGVSRTTYRLLDHAYWPGLRHI